MPQFYYNHTIRVHVNVVIVVDIILVFSLLDLTNCIITWQFRCVPASSQRIITSVFLPHEVQGLQIISFGSHLCLIGVDFFLKGHMVVFFLCSHYYWWHTCTVHIYFMINYRVTKSYLNTLLTRLSAGIKVDISCLFKPQDCLIW